MSDALSRPIRGRSSLIPLFLSPRAMWRFLRDPHTARGPKLGLLLAMAYVLWPADLVPDLVPFFGWLDDLGALTFALAWVERTLRQRAALPEAREKTASPE